MAWEPAIPLASVSSTASISRKAANTAARARSSNSSPSTTVVLASSMCPTIFVTVQAKPSSKHAERRSNRPGSEISSRSSVTKGSTSQASTSAMAHGLLPRSSHRRSSAGPVTLRRNLAMRSRIADQWRRSPGSPHRGSKPSTASPACPAARTLAALPLSSRPPSPRSASCHRRPVPGPQSRRRTKQSLHVDTHRRASVALHWVSRSPASATIHVVLGARHVVDAGIEAGQEQPRTRPSSLCASESQSSRAYPAACSSISGSPAACGPDCL